MLVASAVQLVYDSDGRLLVATVDEAAGLKTRSEPNITPMLCGVKPVGFVSIASEDAPHR